MPLGKNYWAEVISLTFDFSIFSLLYLDLIFLKMILSLSQNLLIESFQFYKKVRTTLQHLAAQQNLCLYTKYILQNQNP